MGMKHFIVILASCLAFLFLCSCNDGLINFSGTKKHADGDSIDSLTEFDTDTPINPDGDSEKELDSFCTSNSDCPSQICINHECRDSYPCDNPNYQCEATSDCSMDFICEDCLCVEAPPKACFFDDECKENEVCVNGYCKPYDDPANPCYGDGPECNEDRECGSGWYCGDSCICIQKDIPDGDKESDEPVEEHGCDNLVCLSFTPPNLIWGALGVGQKESKRLLIDNQCAYPLQLLNIALGINTSSEYELVQVPSPIPYTLDSKSNLWMSVSFEPDTLGLRRGSTDFTIYAPGLVYCTVQLAMTNTPLPGKTEIKITPEHNDFGTLLIDSGTKPVSFCINNNADADATISRKPIIVGPMQLISDSGDEANFYLEDAFPDTVSVPPGESKCFRVLFTPTSIGYKEAKIIIPHNADISAYTPKNPLEIPISGTGTAPCLQASPSPLAFGYVLVGQTEMQWVNICNTCNRNITLCGFSWLMYPKDDIYTIYDPNNISKATFSSQECNDFGVLFSPAKRQSYNETLLICSDDPNQKSFRYEITATGY